MEILIITMFLIQFSIAEDTTMPASLHENMTTTCEEFGRFARFNPYSVLDVEWMLFYYWGPVHNTMIVKFSVPTKVQTDYLKYIFNGHVLDPINWNAKQLLMKEQTNITYLLVEQGDRGEYQLYQPFKGLKEHQMLPSTEIRLKQIGNNRYIGMMNCEDQIAYAFAKITDMPKKNELQDAAATIGFRGHGGKSYLYQGHQWMPIPEADGIEHAMTVSENYIDSYRDDHHD